MVAVLWSSGRRLGSCDPIGERIQWLRPRLSDRASDVVDFAQSACRALWLRIVHAARWHRWHHVTGTFSGGPSVPPKRGKRERADSITKSPDPRRKSKRPKRPGRGR